MGTEPTEDPTEGPTSDPTSDPTEGPTSDPTEGPTPSPTTEPTAEPKGKDSGALRICFEIENINGTMRSSNVFPNVMVVPDWNKPRMLFDETGSVFVSASFLWGVFIVCAVILLLSICLIVSMRRNATVQYGKVSFADDEAEVDSEIEVIEMK